jgi:hypothetical protein
MEVLRHASEAMKQAVKTNKADEALRTFVRESLPLVVFF